MAKRFAGFKPETFEKKILPALGYDGPTDMKSINLFLAASPAAAAKMGKYTMAARRMVEKTGFAPGGLRDRLDAARGKGHAAHSAAIRGGSSPNDDKPRAAAQPAGDAPTTGEYADFDTTAYLKANPDVAKHSYYGDKPLLHYQHFGKREGRQYYSATSNPTPASTDASSNAGPDVTNAQDGILVDKTEKESTGSKMTKKITSDPTSVATKAAVVSSDGGAAAKVATNTGQAGAVKQAGTTAAGPAGAVAQPGQLTAQQVTAAGAAPAVTTALNQTQAAQGQVSPQAQVQAAQMDPTQAASLGLQAAQTTAGTVAPVAQLQATPDQLISGSAVDMDKAEDALQKEKAATVRDELSGLMEDFEGGATPSWAAGAMRAATAQMAARGLGASSMAGMATVQAAMESALPIAQMDAGNKQQMAMFKAEQRAKFLGMDFDQKFQAKVRNAARISEVANMNFTAEQTVALENARMANTVNIANLDARQGKVLADAATMSQLDMANLNNRQQAEVQNAQAFLEMDMANLDNEQQTSLFKAQQRVSAILSDTAAENASRQFNASSQMQTDQFMANLSTQVSQFNVEQKSAMDRFNAGEANAQSRFNAQQDNARDEFNAKNHLVVAQANAAWAQSVTTAKNAAVNQSNRDAALAANNLTMTAYNSVVQRERDMLAWAWQSADNAAERDANVMIANISANKGASGGGFLSKAASKFLATIGAAAVDKVFLKEFT